MRTTTDTGQAGRPPAALAHAVDTAHAPDIETLAVLADDCLDGAECLYDPYLHEGPEDPAGESPAERAAREQVAADVCANCPVHEPCFEYAMRTRPARGVWAGLTAPEISALADWLGVPDMNRGARAQPASTQPGTASSASHLAADHLTSPSVRSAVEPAHRGTVVA